MVRGYFIYFSLFISSTIEAQNIYQNTFTIENASASAEAIAETNDNGCAIAGETTVEGSAQSFLTKMSSDGSIEWTKVYYDLQSHILISNVNDTEIFCSQLLKFLLPTLDNGFILGGGIDSAVNITYPNGVTSSSNYFRMFLIKRNENGDVIWSKKYALNDFNGAADIVENDGDGFYVAAYAHQSGSVSTDGLLMRLDEGGNTLWTKSFGGSFSEGVSDLEKTADGNLIICGTSESFSNNQNIYVIKMDTAGNLIWSKTYGSTGFDYGKSILEAPDGGFFVYGNAGTGNPSYLTLLKIDADGNIQWSNTYRNSLFDSPEKLQYDNSGNLIAIADHLTSSHDGLFLLIDTGGNPIRDKTFGKQSSGSNDFITSVLPIESGYLLGGSTNSFSGSQFEFNGYLIKTDQNLFSACNSDSINSEGNSISPTEEVAATTISNEMVPDYAMQVLQMESDLIKDTLCSSVFYSHSIQ